MQLISRAIAVLSGASLALAFKPSDFEFPQDLSKIQLGPLQSPPVCENNVGPFWMITDFYQFDQADDACAAYGWRLASVTTENIGQIKALVSQCGVNAGLWAASVLGVAGDPCLYLTVNRFSATTYQNLGFGSCARIFAKVLCEEIPQQAVTQTATSYEPVISTGETTTTTTSIRTRTVIPFEPQCTDCPKPPSSSSGDTYCSSDDSSNDYCRDSLSSDWDSSSSSESGECHLRRRHHKLQKGSALLQQQTIIEPVCLTGDCLQACNVSYGGIHLITSPAGYTVAQQECAKYGWSLLDFTSGLSDDLIKTFVSCKLLFFDAGYVNSFNGVQTKCPLVQLANYIGIPTAQYVSPVEDADCRFTNDLPIFCQEHCPLPLASSGVEPGFISITTEITNLITALYIPTTTVVVSETCTETIFTKI